MKNRRVVQYKNVGHRGVVDPVATDVTVTQDPVGITTDGTGNVAGGIALAPRGLTGVNTAGVGGIVYAKPHLPWLYNTSNNFLEYRVTRAHLVVVGNVGSTVTGQVSVVSSPDMIDSLASPAPGLGAQIIGGTSFPLADLASNNRRIPLRIDTSWKKVTSLTAYLSGTTIINNASADDLGFTGFVYRVVNAPVSTNVLFFYLDYDVEFRGVASTNFNV